MGVPILISHNLNFRVRKVIKNKDGLYIMIRGSILQENLTILNLYSLTIDKLLKIHETKTDRTARRN